MRVPLWKVITSAGAVGALLVAWVAPIQAQSLALVVDPVTGSVAISNQSFFTSISFDGYLITSSTDSLVPDPTNTPNVGWDSLQDQGLLGWEEVGVSAHALAELNLTSSTTIGLGSQQTLGKAFATEGTPDLFWDYSVPGSGLVSLAPVIYTNTFRLHVVHLLGEGGVVVGNRAVLYNGSADPVTLDAYVIQSAGGSLDATGFAGFDAANVAGWDEVSLSANALTELNLTGSSTINPGAYRPLSSTFHVEGTVQDLTFQYNVPGGSVASGQVFYRAQLSGDVNNDSVVDIADVLTVGANWQQHNLGADANYDGIVDIADILVIGSNWQNTLGGGGGGAGVLDRGGTIAAVPEPGTLGLLAFGLTAIGCGTLRRGRRIRKDR